MEASDDPPDTFSQPIAAINTNSCDPTSDTKQFSDDGNIPISQSGNGQTDPSDVSPIDSSIVPSIAAEQKPLAYTLPKDSSTDASEYQGEKQCGENNDDDPRHTEPSSGSPCGKTKLANESTNSRDNEEELPNESAQSKDQSNTLSSEGHEVQPSASTAETGSRRSERKAKAFARVCLVLAHEQIIDDDNFLGFTNRKTYLPPKKRKKLCQFKGDQPVKPQLSKSNILKKKKNRGSDKPKIINTNIPKSERRKEMLEKKKIEKTKEIEIESASKTQETVSKENTTEEKVKPPQRKLKWFTCDFCHYKTTNKYYIKRHELIHNKPKISYECHYCEYITKSLIRHKEHEAKHTKEKPFKCQHCDYCSRSYTDFRRHQAKHASEKKYKCPHCDFATKWSRNVSHHILKHTTARPHKCHICGFSFKRIQDLKYHLYRHTDLKPISCDSCDFKCKTNYELRCHKLKHSDERFFACTHPGCSQRTKTKSDLTKHMNIHNTEKKFICGICQKGFNAKSTLAKHVQIHGERVLLKCDICQKCLKTRASLQSHLKLHQGHYPFSCDICNRRFAVKWNMIKHQETHRLGDRPYRCPICPYGARTMEHLLTHIGSMHGKSYAYFCEFCRKPFRRYGQLKIHLKRMHSASINQTSPGAMESMLKEVQPIKDEVFEGDLSQLEQPSMELIEVKQEPIESTTLPCNLDPAETFNDQSLNPEVPSVEQNQGGIEVEQYLEQQIENGNNSTDVNSDNATITASEENPVATVGIYNGFTLPLATKGFEFNHEKRGKKPASWFMDPDNMHTEAADKHKKYLYKKQQGLLPVHRPKLPSDHHEREAEKKRRKLEKYIISCRVSTKSDTTLIFQTEKQKKKSKAKINTVAAILERTEANKNSASSIDDSFTPNNERHAPKSKLKKKKKQVRNDNLNAGELESEFETTKLLRKARNKTQRRTKKPSLTSTVISPVTVTKTEEGAVTDVFPSTNTPSSETVSPSNASTEIPVKRKRGRPKGSKNKKAAYPIKPPKPKRKPSSGKNVISKTKATVNNVVCSTGAATSVDTVTNKSNLSEVNDHATVEHPDILGSNNSPGRLDAIVKSENNEKALDNDILTENPDIPSEVERESTVVEGPSQTPPSEGRLETSQTDSNIDPVVGDVDAIPIKRKRGRPKGSLNKKTLARIAAVKSPTKVGASKKSGKSKCLKMPSWNNVEGKASKTKTPISTQPTPACNISPGSSTQEQYTYTTNVEDTLSTFRGTDQVSPAQTQTCVENGLNEHSSQVQLRPCSVSLSHVTDEILKRVSNSKEDKASSESVLHVVKTEPLEELAPSGILSQQNDPTCIGVKDLAQTDNEAVTPDQSKSNSARKRRKPDKSEIRRKCRVSRASGGVPLSPDSQGEPVTLVTFAIPPMGSPELVVKTEGRLFSHSEETGSTLEKANEQDVHEYRDTINSSQEVCMATNSGVEFMSSEGQNQQDPDAILSSREVKQEPWYEDISDEDTICDPLEMLSTQ